MGAIYHQIEIKFEETKDCQRFYKFLYALSNNEKLDRDKIPEVLLAKFQEETVEFIEEMLKYEWFDEEEGISFDQLNQDENFLEVEFYGSHEADEFAAFIRFIASKMAIIQYEEIESTTSAGGLNFIWWNNGNFIEYYEDQNESNLELNLENGFNYCFSLIKSKVDENEIKPKFVKPIFGENLKAFFSINERSQE